MVSAAPDRTDASRLGFTLRVAEDTTRLSLHEREFFGWLHIERLELELPGGDPLANSGQNPEVFQRRRARVRIASLRIDQRDLDRFIATRGAILADLGADELHLRCCDGYIAVAARVRDGAHVADLTARVYLIGTGLRLRLLVGRPRIYGYLPTPAPLVVHHLLAALIDADAADEEPCEAPRVVGLGALLLSPLQSLLWNTMPGAGWRLPATKTVQLLSARATRGSLQLSYGPHSAAAEVSGSSSAARSLAQTLERFHGPDDRLRLGDPEGALRAWRGELAAGGPEQPFVIDRLLAISSTRPGLFVDAVEIARQALGRWPDFAPAHAALASIDIARGAARDAAERYDILSRIADDEGDDDATIRAALAGARILRTLSPIESTPLYERVLEHNNGHAEAAEALAERYAAEGRWHDSVRLIRARISNTDNAARRSRDHVRLGHLLLERLDDPAAARIELERATEADPENVAAFESLANVLEMNDELDEAIAALERSAALHRAREDVRGEARAQARIASVMERRGELDAARDYYTRALELATDEPIALRGAAGIAERLGEHAAAADFIERLMEIGGHPPALYALYSCDLGRNLAALGETDAARPALERAASQGEPTVAAAARTQLAALHRAMGNDSDAVRELASAVASLVLAARHDLEQGDALRGRASELALERAELLDEIGQPDGALLDYQRAYSLAAGCDQQTARRAARALIEAARERSDDDEQRHWIGAVLHTSPDTAERIALLLARVRIATSDPERDPRHRGDALTDLEMVLALDPELPDRAAALALKARILGAEGNELGRARTLAERAELALDPVHAVEAHIAAGRAWLDADDPDASLDSARRASAVIAELPAGHAESAAWKQRGHELALVMGDAAWQRRVWDDVAVACELLVGLAQEDSADRALFGYRLAVSLDQRGAADEATESLRAVTQNPNAPRDVRTNAWRLLSDLHDRSGAHEDAARALESLASDDDAELTASSRADACYRAGDLFRKQSMLADAERCLEAALTAVPDHLPALDALERIKRDERDFDRVAVIIGRKIAATSRHPNRQKALLVRLAALHAEEFGRTDVARATYGRALEIDPEFRPALRFTARDAESREELTQAVSALTLLASHLAGDVDLPDDASAIADERVAAACRLATIAEHNEEHAAAAGAALAAVADITEHPQLVALREQLGSDQHRGPIGGDDLSDPAEGDEVPESTDSAPTNPLFHLRGLADEALEAGMWQAAAEALEALVMTLATSDKPRSRKQLAQVLLELADLYYDQLDEPPRARDAMRRAADALDSGARRDATLRILAAEASAAGADADAAEALRAISPKRITANDRLNLARCYQRTGSERLAISTLETARTDGDLTEAGAALLFDLHRESKRKAKLAASLVEAASSAPTGVAITHLREARDIFDRSVGDHDAANRVRERLEQLEARAGVDSDGSGPEVRELVDAATAAADKGDTELASDLFARAVETGARRLSRLGKGIDEAVADAVEQLRRTARAGGHYEALVRGLMFASAAELDQPRSCALLREISAILRAHLDDPTGAADALGRALAMRPADAALFDELDSVLRETGDYAQLASGYELHLTAVEGHARARPLFALGCIHRDIFNERDRAGELFVQAHAADPSFQDVWRPLAEYHDGHEAYTLARPLYSLVLDWEELADSERAEIEARLAELDRLLLNVEEQGDEIEEELLGEVGFEAVDLADPSRAEEELRYGETLRASGQLDAAIAHFEAAAAASDGDDRALSALEELYEEIEDFDALSELMGRRIATTNDRAHRAELWHRRARLYRDRLRRGAEAYRCLKEAHANAPDDGDIAHSLRAMAMARSEWALAAELLYREIGAATTDAEAGALHLELALIYDEKLLDAEDARINYEDALRLDPESPAAPRPLARLYELGGRNADAARLGELAAERARTDSERGELYRRAAMSAERAGLEDDARRLYKLAANVADESVSHAAQAALARLSPGDESVAEIEVLELQLREAGDDEMRADLLRQLLKNAATGGDDDAIHRYASALFEVDRSDLSAYLTLKARASDSHDLPELAALGNARAGAVTDLAESAALYFELGLLYQTSIGDLSAAVGAFEQALGANEDHPGALEALATIAYEKNDWPRARQLFDRLQPDTCSLPSDLLAYRRGEIAEVLGREHEAMEAFAEAARLNPSSREALAALARTAVRLRVYKTAIEASEALLDLISPDNVQAITNARLQIGEMCVVAGEIDRAVEYFERVLAEAPKSLSALRALTGLYRRREDHERAAQMMETLVTLAHNPAHRAELLFQLGEVYRFDVGDPGRASDAYLKAVDLEPTHVLTLWRLVDHYWGAQDWRGLAGVAADLDEQNALDVPEDAAPSDLARIAVAAATLDADGAQRISQLAARSLGSDAATQLARAVAQAGDAVSAPEAFVVAVRRLIRWIDQVDLAELREALAAVESEQGAAQIIATALA